MDADVVRRSLGLARWRDAGHALTWWVGAYERRASARGLSMNPDRVSGGAGDTEPRDAQWAAVAHAIGEAEKDDRQRYPRRPAPIREWLIHHFHPVHGRFYPTIAEATNGAWSEVEVQKRTERAVRVIKDELRSGGWLRGSRREGNAA